MTDNGLNMVLANDKSEMKARGSHIGTLITNVPGLDDPWVDRLRDKDEIAQRIYDNVILLQGK